MLGLRTAEGRIEEARQEQASARNWALIPRSDIDGGPRRQDRESHNQPSQAAQSVRKSQGEGRRDKTDRRARHTRRDDQGFNVVFCVLAIATDIVQERKVSIVIVVVVVMMARIETRPTMEGFLKMAWFAGEGDKTSVNERANFRKDGGDMLCQWARKEDNHSIGRWHSHINKQAAKATRAGFDSLRAQRFSPLEGT